jgi:hypothetical protein
MSLSSLLDKLTALVSKNFALAAFVPMLVFAFLNGVLLYFHARWFQSWARSEIDKPSVFDLTAVTVALAVAAYMLSSISLYLREVLEGKRLLPLWPALDRKMRAQQQRRLDSIWKRYKHARDNKLRINQVQKLLWQKQLQNAAAQGIRNHSGTTAYNREAGAAGKTISELRAKRAAADPPSYDELEEAVNLLSGELTANDESMSALRQDRFALLYLFDCAPSIILQQKLSWQKQMGESAAEGIRKRNGEPERDRAASAAATKISELQASLPHPNINELKEAVSLLCGELAASDESASSLRQDRFALLDLFDYAERAWGPLEIRYFNQRQSAFGAGYVAPTSMGNVAESMQNYALSRYRMNLETFWSRLQVVIQSNKEFYSTLQDAKTQLDFLVACCWLSILTWIPWMFALPFVATSVWLYISLALGGPLIAYFFYALGTTNYATLADLVSTSIDLYRFSLLQALHIPVPKGVRQERALWLTLQSLSSFGLEVELSYNPEQKGPAA